MSNRLADEAAYFAAIEPYKQENAELIAEVERLEAENEKWGSRWQEQYHLAQVAGADLHEAYSFIERLRDETGVTDDLATVVKKLKWALETIAHNDEQATWAQRIAKEALNGVPELSSIYREISDYEFQLSQSKRRHEADQKEVQEWRGRCGELSEEMVVLRGERNQIRAELAAGKSVLTSNGYEENELRFMLEDVFSITEGMQRAMLNLKADNDRLSASNAALRDIGERVKVEAVKLLSEQCVVAYAEWNQQKTTYLDGVCAGLDRAADTVNKLDVEAIASALAGAAGEEAELIRGLEDIAAGRVKPLSEIRCEIKAASPTGGDDDRTRRRIVAAAIRKNGEVYTGKRHDLILNAAAPFGALKGGDQGFVTSDGVFVDREFAARIAFAAGQIRGRYPELMSENLINDDPDYWKE